MDKMLTKKINNREAQVCIVGLGYVGLPLAVEVAKAGFKVFGVENNPQRCAMVNEGRNYIKDVNDEVFSGLVAKGMIKAITNFSPVENADIVVICVPTPLNKNKEPDVSYIESSTEGILKHFKSGKLVILESTTYPGTTEEIIWERLKKSGAQLGKDCLIAFSPERVDPGNKNYNTANTTKIVGGLTQQCLDVTKLFYSQFISNIVTVSSPRVAEMTKVFENIFRSVNIALVNELAMLCEKMDIDVYEVIKAADSKPYGFHAFWPGPGVGGHCIPLDPYYLAWKGKEYDLHARFIELAGEINENQPRVVLAKTGEILNGFGKSVKGAKILQLGVAYKKDIDDARESPAVRVNELLMKNGANVRVVDPFVEEFFHREHDFTYGNSGPGIKTEKLTDELLAWADLVILTTDHSEYPYAQIFEKARSIFDTRNAFGFRSLAGPKVVKLSTLLEMKLGH